MTTNDIPGCPKGGPLSGTDGPDIKIGLNGRDGDDKIRGLGGSDRIWGGAGNDVIYGGPGSDLSLGGGAGADVIYGGPGDDGFLTKGVDNDRPDKLYCGEGKDDYYASKDDYVDSSCEEKLKAKDMRGAAG